MGRRVGPIALSGIWTQLRRKLEIMTDEPEQEGGGAAAIITYFV
jgi:hypothetical protein